MTPQQIVFVGNPRLAAYWPSIASASADLRRARSPRIGQVSAGHPAVPGMDSPVQAASAADRRPPSGTR
jgi:hypothetical protein